MAIRQFLTILENKQITKDIYRLKLTGGDLIKGSVTAGQFLNLRFFSDGEFLRRPFSIAKIKEDSVFIYYKVVGKFTSQLKEFKEGKLDVFGPQGRGFGINSEILKKKIYVVGGGIGQAGIMLLYEKLIQDYKAKYVTLVLSAKTKEQILVNEFDFIDKLIITTEDGSLGQEGTTLDVVRKIIEEDVYIFASGPLGMLEGISRLCRLKNKELQISLDIRLGCGMGFCFGCVVNTQEGNKKVCTEGPVFDGKIINWEFLASFL